MAKPEQLIESDREFVKKKILLEVDKFFDDFKKYNRNLMEIETQLRTVTYSKMLFARAYAINLGIILTKKQFQKRFKPKITTTRSKNTRSEVSLAPSHD